MAEVGEWYYSNKVKEHFLNPHNFLIEEPKEGEFDAEGEAGNMACGDIMKVWLKIDSKTKKNKRFQMAHMGLRFSHCQHFCFFRYGNRKRRHEIRRRLKNHAAGNYQTAPWSSAAQNPLLSSRWPGLPQRGQQLFKSCWQKIGKGIV